MKNCRKCGAELIEGAKFCLECGEKVVNEIICAECGFRLPEKAKFCFNCGTKVNVADSVSNVQPALIEPKKAENTPKIYKVHFNGDEYEDAIKGDYEGELVNGIPNGKGKMTSAKGDVYDGEWKDGYKNGIGKMTSARGRIVEGLWENGALIIKF